LIILAASSSPGQELGLPSRIQTGPSDIHLPVVTPKGRGRIPMPPSICGPNRIRPLMRAQLLAMRFTLLLAQ
jgi:hypothetical protein